MQHFLISLFHSFAVLIYFIFFISFYFVLSLVLFVIRFSFFFCIKHSFKPTPCIQRIDVVVPLLFGLQPLAALNRSRHSVTIIIIKNHVKVLHRRFHLNGHTIEFHLHQQKSLHHYSKCRLFSQALPPRLCRLRNI